MSGEPEVEASPALYGHCVTTYKAMENQATLHKFDSATEGIVYEGHLTRLVTQELNLSNPYYTAVTRALKEMGCIRQLRRGGGGSPSQWELIREPTEKLWDSSGASEKIRGPRYATREELASVQQQLRNQGATIGQLQEDFNKILQGLEQ